MDLSPYMLSTTTKNELASIFVYTSHQKPITMKVQDLNKSTKIDFEGLR
uniref:Uncharacterized protein n=1 Tax=Nelumbo nucifera TaxID=4432 RepID=A0A822YG21_NELNU|nr:TPA_asm: hypothetical protein HUJ06_009272 [Nelumbo nucifera]